MPTSRRPLAARLAACAAFPILLLGIASCSAGEPSSTPDQTSVADRDFASWQLAFAQCMRDEGIDFQDPGEDGAQAAGTANEDSMAASQKCADEVGPPPAQEGDQGDKSGDGESLLKAAQCLRDNGVDIADPDEHNSLTIPMDVSPEALEACELPGGVVGGSISGAN